MINLLPYEVRKKYFQEYCTRRTIVLITLLCLLFTASTIVLVSMYMILYSDANTMETNYRGLEKRLADGGYSAITYEASDLHTKVNTILSFKKVQLFSDVRAALERTIDESVVISAMQFVRTENGGGTLSLTARVKDRKHALQWEDRLKSEPLFSGISIPTSSLIKNENIDIQLSFTVVPANDTASL